MSTEPRAPLHALRRRGVTLIEMIVFMVIIGIALSAILGVMNLGARQSADPVRRKQALILAEGLLEEVERANFSYCDPADPNAATAASAKDCTIAEAWGQSGNEPSSAGRPYDNVNDYVSAPGVATSAFDVNGVLSDAGGNPLNLAGYTARVTISPVALGPDGALVGANNPSAGVSTGSSADNEAFLITVQVDYDGQSLSLDGYRTRYAPNAL